MNIEIIDKVDIPAGRIRWQRLLANLSYNRAIKLVFSNGDEAKKQRNNVLKLARLSKLGFYIETQVTQLKDDQWALFIWKEERSNVTNL